MTFEEQKGDNNLHQQQQQQKLSSIKTTTQWSSIDALNQLMTPVPITDSDLQQELDFYASTQFRYDATPKPMDSTIPSTTQANNTFQRSTPQMNIPVDPNDYASSNLRNEGTTFTTSANTSTNYSNGNSLSMLFEQHRQRQTNNGDVLLGHEPGAYGRTIAANQSGLAMINTNQLFSNHNTPINSVPNSPYDTVQQNYFEATTTTPSVSNDDRFAAMFLSSNNNNDEEEKTKPSKKAKHGESQFRFKKNNPKQPLDYSLLSKHNMEQDLLLSAATKSKQKEATTKKRATTATTTKKKQKQKEPLSEDEERDEEDEEEPVIGDGAQSYSSMGSNGSRSSLTKDDKRRRNTAASARFRIKKKMREQALQNTACEMTDKAKKMEQRVHELEREIKWLKALVVEKNEARIEQLVRERPPNSTAFPASSSSSSSALPPTNGYQTNHSSSNNDDYEDDDDDEYS